MVGWYVDWKGVYHLYEPIVLKLGMSSPPPPLPRPAGCRSVLIQRRERQKSQHHGASLPYTLTVTVHANLEPNTWDFVHLALK